MLDITFLVSCFLIPIIVRWIIAFIGSRKSNACFSNTEFMHPKAYLYIGIIGGSLSVVAFSGCIIQGFDDIHIVGAIFLLTSLLVIASMGIYLILCSLFWKLTLDEDQFVYRNIFGVIRIYSYANITRVIECRLPDSKDPYKIVVCVGKTKIQVESTHVNYGRFEYLIKKRLKKAKNPIQFETKITRMYH